MAKLADSERTIWRLIRERDTALEMYCNQCKATNEHIERWQQAEAALSEQLELNAIYRNVDRDNVSLAADYEQANARVAELEERLGFALKWWERGEIPPADMAEFEALFLEAHPDAEEGT
jgi:predicted RNase H-like nuclease (RuvC/YqgF family)